MRVSLAVCLLHVFYCNANEQVSAQLEGRGCTINNIFSGICKPRDDCEYIIQSSRNSGIGRDFQRHEDDKPCASRDICCPYRPPRQPTSVSKPAPDIECHSKSGLLGVCKGIQKCTNSNYEEIPSQCGRQQICCLYQQPTATLPQQSTPPSKLAPGQLCVTLVGKNGTCIKTNSCDKLDQNINTRRYRVNVCTAGYTCCPNTEYHVPKESLTTSPDIQQPMLTTQSSGQLKVQRLDIKCYSRSGVPGLCREIGTCMNSDYGIDYSQCGYKMICCHDTRTEAAAQPTWAKTKRRKFTMVVNQSVPTTSIPSQENLNYGTTKIGRELEIMQCGIKESNGFGAYKESRPNGMQQFPWMATIGRIEMTRRSVKLKYLCGGSLVHYRAVLTAAHCVYGEIELVVRAGTWDLHQDVYNAIASHVLIHPNYNEVSNIYDVALVILTKEFRDATNVELVCLPIPNTAINHESCVATQWNMPYNKTHPLRVIAQPLVEKKTCEQQLARVVNKGFTLDESFLCAGGVVTQDISQSDSGSPLVCTDGTRYYQYGIFSWSVEPGLEGIPGVYSNVEKVVPWISDQLQALQLSN